MLTRRALLATAALASIGANSLPAFAQRAGLTVQPTDVVMGNADAKVTIIEYASMTCGHCAAFHQTTWPTLKSKYIDTGKVKFVLREFPLDTLAFGAFMIAKCGGDQMYYPITDLLFEKQKDWVGGGRSPLDALAETLRQTGMSRETMESCLKRQDLYDAVNRSRAEAEALGVNSTPTFFINGEKVQGAMTVAVMEERLKPLLGE